MAGDMIYMVRLLLRFAGIWTYLDLGIESVLQSVKLLPLVTLDRLLQISKLSQILSIPATTYFHEPVTLLQSVCAGNGDPTADGIAHRLLGYLRGGQRTRSKYQYI
jgi:hypothetical protein